MKRALRTTRLQRALVVTLVLACSVAARAEVPTRVAVRADAIDFYANRMLLSASGHVRARAGNRIVEGDSLRYDLARNTLLVAGNVRVTTAHDTFEGAAYAIDLAGHTATALRLEPLPRTLTVTDDRFADAVETPPAQDAFAAVDLGAERPYIRSSHAVIVPNASIRLTPARFPTGSGVAVPSPSYLYTFQPNPNFVVPPATLPSSSFDQPYALTATTHSLLAAHLRYGSSDGATLGVDEHVVDGLRRYAVGSYLFRGNRFDLGAFEQLTPHLTQSLYSSLASRNNYVRYVLEHDTSALTTTLAFSESGGSSAEDLQTSTVTRQIGHLLSYRLNAGFGFDDMPGSNPFALDFRTNLGVSIYTPSVRGPLGTSVSGQYDLRSVSYDYPHQVASSSVLASISRRVGPALLYGSVTFAQSYNRYGLPQPWQYWGYDPTRPFFTSDGTLYSGRFAYQGIETRRAYYGSAAFNPNPNFNLFLGLTATSDSQQFHGYGPPPLSANFDIRIRPVPNLAVEFGRTYVFGWNAQGFTPQYTLGISP